MSSTQLAFGDPKAAVRWSANLALDVNHAGFWSTRFVGKGSQFAIEEKTELEGEAGDTIHFDLLVNLTEEPTFGDAEVAGTAESMKHRSDRIHIDQMRHPVSAPGRMGRKRSVHNFRKDAKMLLKDYWAKWKDEVTFIYMSGNRGINEDFIMRQGWEGFAENKLRAPDRAHLMYGGDATSKASLTADDKMGRNVIELAETKCRMMRATDRSVANMQPLNIDGGKHYVCVMSPFQEHDMRQDVGPSGWLTVQRDAAAAEGKNNAIFKGGLGMVKNVVLHSHENVVRMDDYGVTGDVSAARALFLGAQAGVCAHGTKDSRKYLWHEEEVDKGNKPEITAGTIWGINKSQFNGKDFGCISIDTACSDPNSTAA
jgi:N4-gp56 family major capsid protein